MKKVLTIAGSDSGAGAGIQADLKTLAALGVYGTSAITGITAQNTKEIEKIYVLPVNIVAKQINAVMKDIGADVWKTGMLANEHITELIKERAIFYKIKKLVVDPVMVSKSKNRLLSDKAIVSLRKNLIPLTYIITPNIYDAKVLTGIYIRNLKDMKTAAVFIHKMGAKNIVIKGGHLENNSKAVDILYDGINFYEFTSKRIKTKNLHGTGCTFASAIAAGIAKEQSVFVAVRNAKIYIDNIIIKSKYFEIGQGNGPLNHFVNILS